MTHLTLHYTEANETARLSHLLLLGKTGSADEEKEEVIQPCCSSNRQQGEDMAYVLLADCKGLCVC